MLTNTISRQIEWGDCDPAGIVFNPNYFRWFDHCTALLYETAGWSKQELVRTFDILGCPVVETGAKFMSPCRYGDIVEIDSAFAEVGRSSFKITHRLSRGATPCVVGSETRVWTVRDAETGKIRAAPLPAEVAERFAAG